MLFSGYVGTGQQIINAAVGWLTERKGLPVGEALAYLPWTSALTSLRPYTFLLALSLRGTDLHGLDALAIQDGGQGLPA